MRKITPFLWFDGDAEEAVNFYVSVFRNSKIHKTSRYPAGGPGPAGKVMTVHFELEGQPFIALNGGPQYKLTEAFSLFVDCEDQEEVDALWEKLSAGGSKGRCGWLKDRFGVSWQVIPSVLGELMGNPDPVKAGRVVQAMMQMGKIDIELLRRAHGH